jgi:hypothetical protein
VVIGLEVEEKKQCALRRSERAIISPELVVVQDERSFINHRDNPGEAMGYAR